MPCYSPLKGYRGIHVNPDTGKRSIVFNPKDGYIDLKVELPCGQCVGCRLERSRQWAVRCMHEASCYDDNCFITLTYDNNHLPTDLSLNVREFQLFMKRLRKRFGDGVRYYHCGEYGEKYGRPHYHACLFNLDFPDKQLFKVDNGYRLYTSEILSDLWQHKGFCTIGDVTFESAAYVARYIMKKVTGDGAAAHYEWFDEDGVVYTLKPEYTTMSRRPGIGKLWYDKFKADVYPSDEVIVRGFPQRPPKFYDRIFEVEYPEDYEKVRKKRVLDAKEYSCNNTSERLEVRRKVKLAQIKMLKRKLEV